MGPEFLGEGAININEIAGSSLTAVNDLLKQNFLSQQIKSASNSSSRPALKKTSQANRQNLHLVILKRKNLKKVGSDDAKKEGKLKISESVLHQ